MTLSNRGAGLQLFCVQSLEQLPRMFLPLTRQHCEIRLPSSF